MESLNKKSTNIKTIIAIKKIFRITVVYLSLILIAIFMAGPFIWLVSSSFKSGQNIYTMSLIPHPFSIANYVGVINFISIPKYILNTIIITVSGIILDIVLASLAAYPLACMDFYGKKLIFSALVSTMILPAAAGLIVNYLTISKMGLLDTLTGVIIPSSVSVFSIILLRQSYLTVPRELLDSARIDGASEFKIWYKIMFPQVMPAISTIVIFDFIGLWNSFLWPIVVLQDPNKYPLAAALKYLMGQFNYKFGYVAAGTVLSIIPVIIVFLAFQKYFINAVAGAIKG
ncbi:sugar ABC transporter permease [Thermoanaerobacterium thermosaccharolyticum]|uniref:carbohydrate ABC transporter permease n=1 Tax=Thermoanaerobacterium thermosaccharolyticum TaxID=1517 RepID=UPI000C06D100|nr:carbohydrate ABC transporter permease [Thermoanaerobacterium thermosaccharolyticum]PHO08555.1 sugar ABC transporter permease [Thermoanaerobacterium thermosaccharolyticum]